MADDQADLPGRLSGSIGSAVGADASTGPPTGTAPLPQTVTATFATPPPGYPLTGPYGYGHPGVGYAPGYPYPPPAYAPAGYPDPERTPAAPSRRRRAAILLGCAVLGTVVGVTAQRWPGGRSVPARATVSSSPSASAAPVTAQITPVSSTGSSLTDDNGTYRSEGYNSAKFGNLKSGIGLQLDLGSARTLRSVAFDDEDGPLTVSLLAGDSTTRNGTGMTRVGNTVTAGGHIVLPASAGGSHRYWLIWVTSLAAGSDGRYRADLANVTALG